MKHLFRPYVALLFAVIRLTVSQAEAENCLTSISSGGNGVEVQTVSVCTYSSDTQLTLISTPTISSSSAQDVTSSLQMLSDTSRRVSTTMSLSSLSFDVTSSPSLSESVSLSPSPSPSESVSLSPSTSLSESVSSPSPSESVSSPSLSESVSSPSLSESVSLSPSPLSESVSSPSLSESVSLSPSPSPSPSESVSSPSLSESVSLSPSPSPSESVSSPSLSESVSLSPSPSPSESVSSPSLSESVSLSPSPSPSENVSLSPSESVSLSPSESVSLSPSPSLSESVSYPSLSESVSLSPSPSSFSPSLESSSPSQTSLSLEGLISTSQRGTSLITSTPISTSIVTPTPTETPDSNTSIWNRFINLFQDSTIVVVIAVGGSVILILILIIIIIICFCCCCRRKRDKLSIDQHQLSNGNVRGTRYRPSISAPQQSYHHELRQVKEERQRLEVFAETELGDVSIDDTLHYQGHSQVQHSQLYNGSNSVHEIAITQQSLSKLTPLNPAQIILQVGGGISVDDDDMDDQLPEQENSQRDARENGGGDSPFLHLSDNLPPSRTRSQNRLPENPTDDNMGRESSQYSYLGLGIMHGSDVVYTNSMADDNVLDISMVGINSELLEESERTSYRTASPLIVQGDDDLLDDKPTKESKSQPLQDGQKRGRDFALLTSLEGDDTVTEKPLQRSITVSGSGYNKPKTLSAMTSLPRPNKEEATPSTDSDLQETPERHRSHTLSTPEGSFTRAAATKSNSGSRLGKLTSLEYIRASLRMKLKKIKAAKDYSPESGRKPEKGVQRKPGSSVSSNDSVNSLGGGSMYANRYVSEYDESPHHLPTMSPRTSYPPPPHEYMGGYPPYGSDDIGPPYDTGYMVPPGFLPLDPYSYPISPPNMGVAPGPIYTDQLSPILSVSQFEYHPTMQIGLLPQYGHPAAMGGYGIPEETYYPSQPPNFDDDEDDDIPYRQNHDMNISASQRNVTWNLQHQEIPPVDPEELTLSDDDNDR